MAEAAKTWAYHGTDHFRKKRAEYLQSPSGGEEVVRLHLGCGSKRLRGFINIDSRGSPDVISDITALPYGEGYADEILAVHVFEHFFPWHAERILKHWYRILKPGGKLALEMPDLRKVLGFFAKENPPIHCTMFALYGGEQSERIEDLHKWCWTFQTIEPLLKEAGFRDVVEKQTRYHVPDRDFRVEAVK